MVETSALCCNSSFSWGGHPGPCCNFLHFLFLGGGGGEQVVCCLESAGFGGNRASFREERLQICGFSSLALWAFSLVAWFCSGFAGSTAHVPQASLLRLRPRCLRGLLKEEACCGSRFFAKQAPEAFG